MGTSEGSHGSRVEPPGGTEPNGIAVNTAEALDLLSDEYARQLLYALGVKPRSASALAERVDASRATVYRRLDDLEAADLIESRVAIDGDGHHRKRFHVAIEALHLRFGDDDIEITPAAASPATTATAGNEIDTAALLSVLGDEYTRAVLTAMEQTAMPARGIADRADVSRPTVYRRLNRLTEVGLVETVTTAQSNGQDRQAYRVALDAVACSLIDGSTIDAAAMDAADTETAEPDTAEPESNERTESPDAGDDRPTVSA
ncbi:ArsR family transcriptional regulator [Halonotius terrestris]|uniref:ArsR family transcriptional regulator n=1 Tax=Halonotius terrestris TaxID=2487750 RepID=A0A8J8TCS9_9EURY|nr:winged helix-turn-helix domain-containing protein [Halonotius terrestris]TQQ82713.1 ArsR family transcriptional regulator [Halonotius terrestris]